MKRRRDLLVDKEDAIGKVNEVMKILELSAGCHSIIDPLQIPCALCAEMVGQ